MFLLWSSFSEVTLLNDLEGSKDEGVEAEKPVHRPGDGDVATSSTPTAEEGAAALLASLPGPDAAGHGESDDDEDGNEELGETASERYRRYAQSTQEEVSDPDEWADVHYVLAAQRDRRLALERAEEMVNFADEDRERRGEQVSEPSASSSASRPIPSEDNENYYQDSLGIARYYGTQLVPREPAAFEDFRWDLIMQGLGPETITVHNSRVLSNYVASCTNPAVRYQAQRLLRHLHGLMVLFQSKDAVRWISAAEGARGWLNADRDRTFFDQGSTEQGSVHGEEGHDDDDDVLVDPQDALLHRDRGDRDGEGPGSDSADAAAARVSVTWLVGRMKTPKIKKGRASNWL
eukprot:s121_g11.t1